MVPQILRVACRGSRLSRIQTEEALSAIQPLLPRETQFQVTHFETPGDRDKNTPLTDPNVPDDFFTRDIDQALLRGEVDLAVHSAKDIPKTPAPGLAVATLLPGRDSRDALICRVDWDGKTPPKVIGTSSPRRAEEIQRLFPGAQTVPLRGTIDERLEQLDDEACDAVIVAACALERLGLSHRISDFLPYETAPMQGRLAVIARSDAEELIFLLKPSDFRMQLLDGTLAELSRPPAMIPPGKPATLYVGTNPDHFQGCEPLIHWPVIGLFPRPRAERVKVLSATLGSVRGVLFASPFAVRCFVDALMHWEDGRTLHGKILLAAGPSTAREIEQMGFQASVAPATFAGLDALLAKMDGVLAGLYLYPCSDAAPTDARVIDAAKRGVQLMAFAFYENKPLSPGPLPSVPFSQVLFTSPSTVTAYFTNYPDEVKSNRTWLAIGPSTLEALGQKGLKGVMVNGQ